VFARDKLTSRVAEAKENIDQVKLGGFRKASDRNYKTRDAHLLCIERGCAKK